MAENFSTDNCQTKILKMQAEIINNLRSEIKILKEEKNTKCYNFEKKYQTSLLNEKCKYSTVNPNLSLEKKKLADKECQSNLGYSELQMNDDIIEVVKLLNSNLHPNLRDFKQREVLRVCTFKLKQIALQAHKLQLSNEKFVNNDDIQHPFENLTIDKRPNKKQFSQQNDLEKTTVANSCQNVQSNQYSKQNKDIKTIIDSSIKLQVMTDAEKFSFKNRLKLFLDDVVKERKENEKYKQMCKSLQFKLSQLSNNTVSHGEIKQHCQYSHHPKNRVKYNKDMKNSNKDHINDSIDRKIGFSSTSRVNKNTDF